MPLSGGGSWFIGDQMTIDTVDTSLYDSYIIEIVGTLDENQSITDTITFTLNFLDSCHVARVIVTDVQNLHTLSVDTDRMSLVITDTYSDINGAGFCGDYAIEFADDIDGRLSSTGN